MTYPQTRASVTHCCVDAASLRTRDACSRADQRINHAATGLSPEK
jgi:hypothetical protein